MLGAAPYLLIGDDAAPLVGALLGYGIDARCHVMTAEQVTSGNAITPGRFFLGDPIVSCRPLPAGRANIVAVEALDELPMSRLQTVLSDVAFD
jgi:hypothetical protein